MSARLKYADAIAKVIISGPLFAEKVEALANEMCDVTLRELASELRQEAERDLKIEFGEDEEDEHFEFAMHIEGDVCMAAHRRVAKLIGEF